MEKRKIEMMTILELERARVGKNLGIIVNLVLIRIDEHPKYNDKHIYVRQRIPTNRGREREEELLGVHNSHHYRLNVCFFIFLFLAFFLSPSLFVVFSLSKTHFKN